jgi:predicted outer membrane repeat protein
MSPRGRTSQVHTRKDALMSRQRVLIFAAPVLTALLAITQGLPASAQTTVPPGEVSGTWFATGSPYRITGDINIPNDSSLIIEPGVTVEFQGHYGLLVNGRLLAIGTETDSILFTINDTTGWSDSDTTLGGWNHIHIFEPPATNDSTILEYCRIQYGKAIGPNWPFNHGGAISVVGFNKVRISHCLISHNMSGGKEGPSGGGIGVTYCDIQLSGNTISFNHSESGGGIHLSQSNAILSHNKILGNSATENGGGVGILGDPSGTFVVTFHADTIADNYAGPASGGIIVFDLDSLVLQSVILRENHAVWGGGVGALNSSLYITDCTFKGNSSDWLGGGIAADYCTLHIQGTEFLQNLSQDAAGAMHNDHCTMLLANSIVSDNRSGNDTLAGPAGGINAFGTNMTVQDCQFRNNVTRGIGGAINGDSLHLTVERTEFVGNDAQFAGGGIHLTRSILDVYGSSLKDNSVGNDSIFGVGGGLRTMETHGGISDSQIDSNMATGSGGGIATGSDILSIDGTSLTGNRAKWRGGGVLTTDSHFNLSESALIGNVAGNDTIGGVGGGMDVAWGEISLSGCTISAGTATTGAGLNLYNCDVHLQDVSVVRNLALGDGGALLYTADSTVFGRPFAVHIERCQFDSNGAVNQTAGVRIVQSTADTNQVSVSIDQCKFRENQSRATTGLRIIGLFRDIALTNTSFVGNRSTNQSAAAGIVNGWGTVANCLFARNVAGSDSLPVTGAGLSLTQDSRVDVINCTFSDNRSAGATALSIRTGALVWLTNCILWGNQGLPINMTTASSPTGCHLWVNYSLVEMGEDSVNIPDTLSTLHWGVGNIDEDPQFEDPGSVNYHLKTASPCIGAGIDTVDIDGHIVWAPVTDLEGQSRPAPAGTKPDMGAFEEGATIPVGVDKAQTGLPTSFGLYQNYPNPFNPLTVVRYQVPIMSRVMLVVYDVLGQETEVLLNELRAPGSYEVKFDASGLATGVYFYRLTAGSFVQTLKMLVVK